MSDVLGNKGKAAYSTDNTTFTDFAGIQSIKSAEPNRAEIPNTALDSTSKTTLGGLPDYGDLELEIKFKPAMANTIKGWFDNYNGTDMYFKATLNDQITPTTGNPSSGVYTGYIKKYTPFSEVKNDELLKTTLTVKVNAFTFTPAT